MVRPILPIALVSALVSLARATPPPLPLEAHPIDQLLPYGTPLPTGGLELYLPGVPVNRAHHENDVTWARPDLEVRRITAPEPTRGMVFTLGATTWLEGTLRAAPIETGGGVTIALWFRVPPDRLGVPLDGINPLFSLIDWQSPDRPDALANALTLALDGGYPVVLAGSDEAILFRPDANGSPLDQRLDDGAWHHLAVTFQDLCAPGASPRTCPTETAAGTLRMVVDGALHRSADVRITSRFQAFTLGEVSTGERLADAPNASFLGPAPGESALRAIADVDDVFVYSRALSLELVQRLIDKHDERLVSMWPPQTLADLSATSDYEGPLARADGLTTPLYYAPIDTGAALSTVTRGRFELPDTPELGADATGFEAFSALAWLRPRAGKNLGLRVRFDEARVLEAELTASGDAHRLRARCDDDAFQDLAAARSDWQHLALVRDAAGVVRVALDGFGYAVPCATGAVTGLDVVVYDPGSAGSGAVGDVATVDLFGRALARTEVAALGRAGPDVWVNPRVAGATPTDFAGLLPVRWSQPPTFAVALPFTPTPDGTTPTAPNAVVIDAIGPLSRAEDPDKLGPFTLSLTLRVGKLEASGAQWVTLARRHVSGDARVSDVDVMVLCDTVSCHHLSLTAVRSAGDLGGGTMLTWVIDRDIPFDVETTITLAWPHVRAVADDAAAASGGSPYTLFEEPYVAFDGVEIVRESIRDNGRIHSSGGYVVAHPLKGKTSPNVLAPARPMVWSIGAFGSVPRANQHNFAVSDLRLYGRAVENVAPIAAPCFNASCDEQQRVCVGSTATSPRCLECLDGSFPVARGIAGDGAECEATRPFRAACAADAQCDSGVCVVSADGVGTCGAASAAECEAGCLGEGRACVTSGNARSCGGCRDHFVRFASHESFAVDAPELRCRWNPTKQHGEVCTSAAECFSGGCVPRATNTYQATVATRSFERAYQDSIRCSDGNNTNPRSCVVTGERVTTFSAAPSVAPVSTCATADHLLCDREGYQTIVRSGALPDGNPGTYYACGERDDACRSAGEGTFEPTWSVLSPSACVAAWRSAFDYEIIGECDNLTAADCDSLNAWRFDPDYSDGTHPRIIYPTFKEAFLTGQGTFDVLTLREIFLDMPRSVRLVPEHITAMERLGVGLLLIQYADATPERRAVLEAEHGAFLPLAGCSLDFASGVAPEARAYVRDNTLRCEPKRQDDGATCPPAGETDVGGVVDAGHGWCASRYCARDTHVCEAGGKQLQEVRGQAQNDDDTGLQGVKFGIIRCDDTTLEIEENQGLGTTPVDDDWRYKADLSQSWSSCLFGIRFPTVPLLDTDLSIDKTEGAECAENKFSMHVLGLAVTAPPPRALASCTGLEIDLDGVCPPDTGGCELLDPSDVSLASLAQRAIPEAALCVPFLETLIDRATYEKRLLAGVVPLKVQVGPTLDVCVEAYIGLADEGMPKFELKPVVALGVEARAGVGIDEGGLLSAWAGVKLAVTLASIAFPIGWGIEFDIRLPIDPKTGRPAPLLKMKIGERMMLELEFLSGTFAVFAEFAIGWLSFEWSQSIFEWTGIKLTKTLHERTLSETNVDFRFSPDVDFSKGGQSSSCDGECR